MFSYGTLDNYKGPLPLFPLPNVVFFPHTFLPLHVFEPRYRQMVKDSMDRDGLIGMVLLKPGWEHYEGENPPIYEMACIGQIIRREDLDDGRFNIILHGLTRAKIERVDTRKSYRRAFVDVVEDIPKPVLPRKENWLRRELFEAFGRVIEAPYWGFSVLSAPNLDLGILADFIASSLPCEALEKQRILDAIHPEDRVHRLSKLLEREEEQGKRLRVKQLPFLHELARN